MQIKICKYSHKFIYFFPAIEYQGLASHSLSLY